MCVFLITPLATDGTLGAAAVNFSFFSFWNVQRWGFAANFPNKGIYFFCTNAVSENGPIFGAVAVSKMANVRTDDVCAMCIRSIHPLLSYS